MFRPLRSVHFDAVQRVVPSTDHPKHMLVIIGFINAIFRRLPMMDLNWALSQFQFGRIKGPELGNRCFHIKPRSKTPPFYGMHAVQYSTIETGFSFHFFRFNYLWCKSLWGLLTV